MIYPTFCYPILYNKYKYNIYNKTKLLYIMDKVSVYYLDPLNLRCPYQSKKKIFTKLVLCYEVFKKWPLLSQFPNRIR